jgi:hypothetical protein
VEAAALPRSGSAPLEVQLSAAGTDPDGDALTYSWDFGDGSASATGAAAEHTYTRAGTYTATVTAVDGHGGSASATVTISVTAVANRAPTVEAAADPRSGTAPLTVQFSSAARDADGDGLLSVWSFGDGGQAGGPDAVHTYTQPGTYDAAVTVTDPSGASATATVQVVVAATPAAAPKPDTSAPVAPEQAAWFGVGALKRTTAARFAARGLVVRITCTEAMSGTATLKVSSKTARGLKLTSTTLARAGVRCTGAGTRTVTLKPSRAARRALAAGRRAVKATLDVRLDGTRRTKALTLR